MADNLAPYEFLWLVYESAYGTTKTTPTAGVDSIYIRLAGANRFSMRPVPTKRKVAFGGGFGKAGYAVSDQWIVSGNLSVELCYSQAKLLMALAMTRVASGELQGAAGWATTEQNGDLASCSIYHGIAYPLNGTVKRLKYSGVKVHNWKLTSSAESGLTMLDLTLRAKKYDGNATDSSSDPDETAFPAPADTAFPVDPILYSHCGGSGTLLWNSTELPYVNGIELNCENVMDAKYFNGAFLTFDKLRGRNSTFGLDAIYTSSPAWRSLLNSLNSDDASVSWTNGVNTVAITYNGNNLVDLVDDNLTPGEVYSQRVTLENQWDTSASTDMTFTFS